MRKISRDNRNTFETHLKETFVDEPVVKDLFHELEVVITRFMYNKSLKAKFEHGIAGKFEEEKLVKFQHACLKWIQSGCF